MTTTTARNDFIRPSVFTARPKIKTKESLMNTGYIVTQPQVAQKSFTFPSLPFSCQKLPMKPFSWCSWTARCRKPPLKQQWCGFRSCKCTQVLYRCTLNPVEFQWSCTESKRTAYKRQHNAFKYSRKLECSRTDCAGEAVRKIRQEYSLHTSSLWLFYGKHYRCSQFHFNGQWMNFAKQRKLIRTLTWKKRNWQKQNFW